MPVAESVQHYEADEVAGREPELEAEPMPCWWVEKAAVSRPVPVAELA